MIFFKEIPENGADVTHLNVVHKPAMITGSKPKDAIFSWSFLKHVWSASWAANDKPGEEYKALMKVHHHMSIFNNISLMKMDVEAHQVNDENKFTKIFSDPSFFWTFCFDLLVRAGLSISGV